MLQKKLGYALLVGMHNETNSLKNSLTVSSNSKQATLIKLRNHIIGHLLQIDKKIISTQNLVKWCS